MKKIIGIFAILCVLSIAASAQTMQMEFRKWDNTDTKIQLSNIRNLVFSGTDLQVNLKNGTQTVLPKSDVRKMVFTVATGTLDPTESKNEIRIFPNPATTSFQLSVLPAQNTLVSIYSISGQVLIQKSMTSADEKIDISEIPAGIYLVKINDQVQKLTKK